MQSICASSVCVMCVCVFCMTVIGHPCEKRVESRLMTRLCVLAVFVASPLLWLVKSQITSPPPRSSQAIYLTWTYVRITENSNWRCVDRIATWRGNLSIVKTLPERRTGGRCSDQQIYKTDTNRVSNIVNLPLGRLNCELYMLNWPSDPR